MRAAEGQSVEGRSATPQGSGYLAAPLWRCCVRNGLVPALNGPPVVARESAQPLSSGRRATLVATLIKVGTWVSMLV